MTTPFELNLDYAHASRVLLPTYDTVALALIGCGWTGSWLAPSVVRVGRLLTEKFNKRVKIFFVDPDRVEAKNCYRQNFCEAEIGRNKAQTLGYRYGVAWGMEVTAIPQVFQRGQELQSQDFHLDFYVYIGCVDNAAARKEIQETVSTGYGREMRKWWIDCGNHQAAGQVLVGCGANPPKNPFELPEVCSWLPMPSIQHPELLVPEPETATPEDLSCADMAMLDSQGLAINQRIAAEAGDYLVRLLVTKDLRRYATYLDLAAGSTRSKYIASENITQYLKS